MYFKSLLIIAIFICISCNNIEKEGDINYFRLVRFDTINLLPEQAILFDLRINPDPSNIYLTEYHYQIEDDSIVAIPRMIKIRKSKEIIKMLRDIISNVDTTIQFPRFGAYGISTENHKYYVEENQVINAICTKLIKKCKKGSFKNVDYYEFHKTYNIPLPPLSSKRLQ